MYALDLDVILRYTHEISRDGFFPHSVYNWKREGGIEKGLPSGLWNQTSTQDKGEDALLHRIKMFNTSCLMFNTSCLYSAECLWNVQLLLHLPYPFLDFAWSSNGKKSPQLTHLNIDVSLSRFKHFCLCFDPRWLIPTSRSTCFLVWWWIKSWS